MSNNLHWKVRFLNPQYLGVAHLYEGGVTEPQKLALTIKGYEIRDVVGEGGRTTKDTHVMTFVETDKALILKATNLKRIAAVMQTPITDQWLGRKIVVQQEMELIKQTKQVEPVLRVSADPADYTGLAPKKEVMTQAHPKYAKMIEAIRDGKTTIDAVRGKYDIDAATLAEISRETMPQEGGANEAV